MPYIIEAKHPDHPRPLYYNKDLWPNLTGKKLFAQQQCEQCANLLVQELQILNPGIQFRAINKED